MRQTTLTSIARTRPTPVQRTTSSTSPTIRPSSSPTLQPSTTHAVVSANRPRTRPRSLDEVADEVEARNERTRRNAERNPPSRDPSVARREGIESIYLEGPVLNYVSERRNGFYRFVRLPEEILKDIAMENIPHIIADRARGPPPKASWMDHLVLLLMLYSVGVSKDTLARMLKLKPTLTHKAIKRMRPILHRTLSQRW